MSCGCGCDNDTHDGYTLEGSGLKYAVSIICEGFDMDEDDWEITVSRGQRKIVFTPENAIREVTVSDGEEKSQWYICFDSEVLGPGEVWITFVAYVPDDDFEGGIRCEMQEFKLINLKASRISRYRDTGESSL